MKAFLLILFFAFLFNDIEKDTDDIMNYCNEHKIKCAMQYEIMINDSVFVVTKKNFR